MPFTISEGSRIYWRLEGEGALPPLVLLHSIGTEKGIFDRLAPLLTERFSILRIDLRGHGASDAPDGEYSLSLLGRDVYAVMDNAGIDRAIVCGVSLGGMIAMQMALDVPERISGLALACTSAGMDPAMWPDRIATVRKSGMGPVADGWETRHFSPGFLASQKAEVATARRGLLSMDVAGYIGSAAAIRDMDLLGKLAGIQVPTTVIAGEFDIATPYEAHGGKIVAALAGAQTAMLPTGHLSCIECPDKFASALFALADRCE